MVTMSFKLSESEARRVRALARARRLTVSEFIRRQLRARPVLPAELQQVRCPHTGALVFSRSGRSAGLDSETVREILADFP